MALDHYLGMAWLALWLAIIWAWPNTQQWMARFEPALNAHVKPAEQPFARFWGAFRWQPNTAYGIVVSAVAVIAILGLSQISEFLYFQF